MDRGEVAVFGAIDVVGVAELFDLPLAQPADRAREQPGDLGPERGRDLRRSRQQEVAGQDRLQVAPASVHGLDAAASLGLVHHVVVVQRTEVDEFACDPAAHDVVARLTVADASGDDREDGTKPLPTGDDQV